MWYFFGGAGHIKFENINTFVLSLKHVKLPQKLDMFLRWKMHFRCYGKLCRFYKDVSKVKTIFFRKIFLTAMKLDYLSKLCKVAYALNINYFTDRLPTTTMLVFRLTITRKCRKCDPFSFKLRGLHFTLIVAIFYIVFTG